MITSLILSIFLTFLNYIIGLLPVGSLPAQVSEALTYFLSKLGMLSTFLPVSTFLLVFKYVVDFEIVVLGLKLFLWIISKIRGGTARS